MLNTLFILNETVTNGYSVEILDIVSFISILSAILVITIKNPIPSVLSLIVLFFSIAGYLMFLGFNFIGLAYLLVYVGAVSILFLFILMLINVKISELVSNTSNSIPLAILTVIIFNLITSEVTPQNLTNSISIIESISEQISNIFNNVFTYNSTSISWDSNLSETSHITSIGNIMYTSYSIWLILTSIILLLAMVGAIVITIKQKD